MGTVSKFNAPSVRSEKGGKKPYPKEKKYIRALAFTGANSDRRNPK